MSIEAELKKLNKTKLVVLVDQLYGIYGDIDEIIERHLAAAADGHDRDSLISAIQYQLTQFREDPAFFDYHSSRGYATRLRSLLADIDNLLRPQDPQQALQATEQFLRLHSTALESVDDSDGEVGDVFREAVSQWLKIACEVRSSLSDAENWTEKLLSFFNDNDYGVLDDIIRDSSDLLTADELTQLAWRFETDLKKALKTNRQKGYNFEAAHASIGMRSVAEALSNMELFEKSCLLFSPQPNTLQLQQVVEFALAIGDFDRAWYWLSKPIWKEDSSRFKELRNSLLELQGDTKTLKKYLAEDFQKKPNAQTLADYWAVANKAEQKALYQQMPKWAESSRSPGDAVSMAFIVGHHDLAEKLLLKNKQDLTDSYYGLHLSWLKKLDENSHPLACIVCYRCLLNDILQRGVSKAYHHAADYFRKLLVLDKQISDYRNLDDAQVYIRRLQETHWRKRSFWELAGHPNKPI
ncbi:DUF6880 family protein [Gynuella sunshinyii]|uniref:Uncharacterized protein n=1 Tax=Gynuella sunshinyii YC6258 TaxID=1445510 RepID=A0A0C5VL20_9GAMM|nr:DUF6880 family protein [Gynuella sunshinyii]AJQ95011.1 hypothetical Protein YC6258_02973 [Gynuella sunshinyii YC6258]